MNTKLRDIEGFYAVRLALVLAVPSVGQAGKGSISGSVIDPQGAVASGAQETDLAKRSQLLFDFLQ